jgi:multiple sugar transport system ATP-binding protein
VTHDQTEAMTMGDRVAVIRKGVLQQADTPQYLYDHPVNLFVAGFIGSPSMNFLTMKLESREGRLWLVSDQLALPAPDKIRAALDANGREAVTIGIRPEHILARTTDGPPPEGLSLEATVDVVELLGNEQFVYLDSDWKDQLVARVAPEPPLEAGQRVELILPADRLHFFDVETEQAIHREEFAVPS